MTADWFWRCNVHDTLGNAGSEDEARHMADAHEDWWRDVENRPYSDDAPCDSPCKPETSHADSTRWVAVS